MIKLIQGLADRGYIKLSHWLCVKTENYDPVFYNVHRLEPDMTCWHCGEEH